jgi:hypothetical protein
MVEGIVENTEEVKQVLEGFGGPILTPRGAINAVKQALETA